MLTTPFRSAAAFILVGVLCGLALWGGYEGATGYATSTGFCTSCHEMQPMADEYMHSIHYLNPSGVRAQCADCHVPKPLVPRVIHMIAATRDLIGHARGVIDTPEKLAARRPEMAQRVWAEMTVNGSLTCRGCHSFEAMDFAKLQPKAADAMHGAMQIGTPCIGCHKGIAHRLVTAPTAPPKPPAAPAVAAAAPQHPASPQPPASTAALPPAAAADGKQVFVCKAVAPLAAASGDQPFARLYVSAAVTVLAVAPSATHVKARFWMKGDAVQAGNLYAAPGGIEIGRLDALPGGAVASSETRDGWTAVGLDGVLPSDTVVESLQPVWQTVESNYSFTCGGCHALYAPATHPPAQWATEMETMAKSANLGPDDAMMILKWLQTTSAADGTGK